MTKKYETVILFDPELPEDRRKEFVAKLAGVVGSFRGEVLKQDDWGNRKMAYQIGKKVNAYYTFLTYTGDRGVVEEVERNIKIFDGVLRHMTSRVEFEVKGKPAAAETPQPAEGQPPAAGPAAAPQPE